VQNNQSVMIFTWEYDRYDNLVHRTRKINSGIASQINNYAIFGAYRLSAGVIGMD